MTQAKSRTGNVKLFPPPPKGFDATTASITDLARHGLPPRPDAEAHPVSAAQWDHIARRYARFEHVEPGLELSGGSTTAAEPLIAPFGLDQFESCGYELVSTTAFTSLAATWTVPDLNYTPSGFGPNEFRTFLGLGFLDVHVEMTVDSAQNVTALIRVHTGAQIALAVRPGDVMSAVLCAPDEPEGPNQSPSGYFLANETTLQSANFQVVTGFPPAKRINAGISRAFDHPNKPLARFGAVYFDDILAVTADGSPSITDGTATTMISFPDPPGLTLARPVKLNQSAFKIVYEGE